MIVIKFKVSLEVFLSSHMTMKGCYCLQKDVYSKINVIHINSTTIFFNVWVYYRILEILQRIGAIADPSTYIK